MNREMMLEARIAKLEKFMNEKIARLSRNGEESLVFKIWQFLMDKGTPQLRIMVQNEFSDFDKAKVSAALRDGVKEGCFEKGGSTGERFLANPDYDWGSDIKPRTSVKVRSNGKIRDVAPVVEEPIEEPAAPIKSEVPVIAPTPVMRPSGNHYGVSTFAKAIVKVLGTAKQKSEFLGSLESGFNAIEALEDLPKKKRDALGAEFNSTFDKFCKAISKFGVDKFTRGLKAEFKKQGIRAISYDIPDERDDWDDYSGGDGYDNKSFDYYNNDDLRW